MKVTKSIIYTSHQGWKFWSLAALGYIGVAMMATSVFYDDALSSAEDLLLSLPGVILALGSIVLKCLIIRCPKCGSKWYWTAISKKPEKVYMKWLLSKTACPDCGSNFQ